MRCGRGSCDTAPRRRASGRSRPARPWAGLLEAFDAARADLGEGLAGAGPTEEAWTWAEDHTVGFVARRQALEAQVHRVDAEQTAGLGPRSSRPCAPTGSRRRSG